jgi:hypothetical protein
LLGNTPIPRQRSEPLRSISMPGTDHVKKVGGFQAIGAGRA